MHLRRLFNRTASSHSLLATRRLYATDDKQPPQGQVAVDDFDQEIAASIAAQPDDQEGRSLVAPIAPDVAASGPQTIFIERLMRPPARYDLLTRSLVFQWRTTAGVARKVTGPMMEWAGELKYRTGVHLEVEPTHPEKINERRYENADDVELTVLLFGTDHAVEQCRRLMENAIQQDPAYVRLGLFRRSPQSKEVEWLLLRRINRETRPADIPAISLKLPGKWSLFYEQHKEAAIRTCWEETGIRVQAKDVYPSGSLFSNNPYYYWRVPVKYFLAEVPHDVHVLGPQSSLSIYMQGWDARLLRQSPDPIDRVWAQHANPDTGCCWLKSALIDELQKPIRGDHYMALRYTPPPFSNLQEVVGLVTPTNQADNTQKST